MAPEKTKILQKVEDVLQFIMCIYNCNYILSNAMRAGDCQTFKIDEKFQNNRRLL